MDVGAYLQRIGVETLPRTPDLPTLRHLHRCHLLTVPFENLDIHRRTPIVLDLEAISEKVVSRRRGGFCYELNGLFGALLAELGFATTRLSARVLNTAGELGAEFDHLTTLVDFGAERYLADVGFGDSFLEPLKLDLEDLGAVREDPAGRFRFASAGGEELWMEREEEEGGFRGQYRVSLIPRRLEDFAQMCQYHQTSPRSHFTRKRVCSRATEDGRITVTGPPEGGGKLIETVSGVRRETSLDEKGFQKILWERFGIDGRVLGPT